MNSLTNFLFQKWTSKIDNRIDQRWYVDDMHFFEFHWIGFLCSFKEFDIPFNYKYVLPKKIPEHRLRISWQRSVWILQNVLVLQRWHQICTHHLQHLFVLPSAECRQSSTPISCNRLHLVLANLFRCHAKWQHDVRLVWVRAKPECDCGM